jgi:hypothetical protein
MLLTSVLRRWRIIRPLLANLLVGTVGTMLSAALASYMLKGVVWSLAGIEQSRNAALLLFIPPFPLHAIAGFVLGVSVSKQWPSRVQPWIWIAPLGFFLSVLVKDTLSAGFLSAVAFYFGTSCEFPDCTERLLVVAPVIGTLMFSFGAWSAGLKLAKR